MPVPQELTLGKGSYTLTEDFEISLSGQPDDRLLQAATRFLRRLSGRTGLFLKKGYVTEKNFRKGGSLHIHVNRPGAVKLHEDESYQLAVTGRGIRITAETDLGAMHALQTILQLIQPQNSGYALPQIEISDQPRFPWRGLMLDVARHFQPIGVIKRNLDGMAAVKMNVLHLHLTDDQGFRVESKTYPVLHQKGSDGQYFTQVQLQEIVNYAADRGIRVVPEFDVPGHASSWLTAMPELGSVEGKATYDIERNAGIFDPTLDPTNENTYEVLAAVFKEMAEIFPDEYFHIGGDENEGRHWDANKRIQAFKKKHGFKNNHELQNYFNTRLLGFLKDYGKRMVGWDEIRQPGLPKSAVIQSWRGIDALVNSARSGYQTFLSNGYYIDLMHTARHHYKTDPLPDSINLTDEQRKLILGGEATMWGELVIPYTIDSRIWPRTAVIAERLWSPQHVSDMEDMYRRMEIVSLQLEELGLQHISSRNQILRKLSAGRDIGPLQTLSNISSPLQGYTRNPGGTMYQSYSPFTLWADAAIADSEISRSFDKAVRSYLEKRNPVDGAYIKKQLLVWYDNHQNLIDTINASPMLLEIEGLSAQLMEVSGLGLEAIGLLEKNETPDLSWLAQADKTLKKARKQGGRTELMNVNAIEQIVRSLVKVESGN
jgi:hexosaminidase